MYSVLFGSCLPITAMMVPVYALFVQLKMLDSQVSVILFMAATSLPMAIWMLKNFMDSVPVSLEEAAWVDGASAMRALWTIVLPLMRPGISVVFIFVFTQAWGNFFVPFVLLFSSEKMPAAVRDLHLLRQPRRRRLRAARRVRHVVLRADPRPVPARAASLRQQLRAGRRRQGLILASSHNLLDPESTTHA